ncbi:MAG TPA: tetratricopeptide repeat protein, partial [Dongiaceae bacterium]|nr:tetratricopeptide repeat protein [Dongiaceae bacterium]
LPPRPPKGGEGRGEEGRADPRALKQQGDALARESRFAEAAAVYRQALALAPDFVEVHNNLGNVLKFLGREEEAIACYRRALELRPAMVDALNNLGVCLAEKDEAAGLPYFRRVLELNPGSAAAHANLAVNLTKAGRFEGVPALFRRAIKLDPNLLEARVGLATCLAQQGAPEDAAAELRAALAIDPDFLPAYFTLAELPGDRLTAEDHARLRSVSARKDLRPEHRAPLLFLLAAREERAGRHAAAFELASRANALERRRLGFSAEAEADFIRRTMAVFDDSFFRENRVRGSESELPVFVVGLPRSGTTLIEQIIASHPKAAGAGEVIEIGRIANGLQAALGADAPFPGCAARLGQEKARELAEAYLKHLGRHGPGAARVVDKMSSNFRLLGLIALLLPRARIIHCRRDPRDTAVSCFFLHFHKPMGFAYDLRDFAAYYRGYEALMAHWHRVLPMPILDVQYEELVAAPEPKIRQMLAFCGLEWDERCLSFQSNGRAVRTASMWQVRRPLYASSIGRWRRYEKQLAPLLEALGHHTPSCQASGLASTSSPAETNDRCVRPEADRLVDARAKHEHDGGVLPGEGAPGRPLHELAPGAPSPQPSPPVGERGLDGSVGERGRALRGEGGDPRALKRRADSLARESRFAEAEALYRRALALAPDLAEAHNNLGNVLTYLGRGEEAAGCYRQALRHKPGLVDAHNNLGAWLAQRDLPEAAAHHFREVLKAEPAHAEAQLNLAKLLVKLGDRSAAAEHFRRAAGSPRATSEVQLQSGIGLTACRLPEEAAALLAGLIGREPLNAAAYRALATALADQGKLDEALAQARQAVEIEPRNGLSHAELALLLKAEGRAMDARFHARLAVELGPQLARAHLVSASLLESLGETQAAAKAYREAIRLAPDQPEAHSSLGVLLMNAGHAGAALKALRRAAELAPRDPSVLNNLGIGLQESGSYDEARAVFAKALEIEPQFAEALCNLAMIEQQLGRIAEARALYRRAHELKPALPGAILGLVQLSERKAEAVPAEAMESVLAGAALDGAG